MTLKTNPQALLDHYESQSVSRIKHSGQELISQPSRKGTRALDWVRKHPYISLATSAGVGFFLSPGRKVKPEAPLLEGAAKVTHAGKWVLYARVLRTLLGPSLGLGSFFAPGSSVAQAAATDDLPDLS